jgi:phosphoribosylglycinamide formyltransferase-1
MPSHSQKTNIGVLISGRGSNLQELINAAKSPDYPAHIAVVISNQPDAYGLTRAHDAGIATQVISHHDYPTREAFDEAMHQQLLAHGIEFVCLAGFMRILSAEFVAKWRGRMINIHPSLLPKFKGLHTHERAIAEGESEHGCTIHWVTTELDSGDIIAQSRVAILPDDTPDTLAARVLEQENQLYPDTLASVLRALP